MEGELEIELNRITQKKKLVNEAIEIIEKIKNAGYWDKILELYKSGSSLVYSFIENFLPRKSNKNKRWLLISIVVDYLTIYISDNYELYKRFYPKLEELLEEELAESAEDLKDFESKYKKLQINLEKLKKIINQEDKCVFLNNLANSVYANFKKICKDSGLPFVFWYFLALLKENKLKKEKFKLIKELIEVLPDFSETKIESEEETKKLEKEYLFNEDTGEKGKIYEKICSLFKKYYRNFRDIFEKVDIESEEDPFLYLLASHIFQKRIVGLSMHSLREFIQKLEKKNQDENKLRRNLIYKNILDNLNIKIAKHFLLYSNTKRATKIYEQIISKLKIEKKDFLKAYYEINRYYFRALNSYKNYKKIINKERDHLKRCHLAYLTIMEIKGITDFIKVSLELKNSLIISELQIGFLEAINEALSKDKYDPTKCKSLDYFLFGIPIKTPKGKIIKGYVEKDFLDWFKYLFRKKENAYREAERLWEIYKEKGK